MIKYAIKRCESFGFANTVEKAKELLEEDDITLIDDDHPIPVSNDFKDKRASFIVVLGKTADVEEKLLDTNEEDVTYLKSLLKTNFEEATACLELYRNHDFFNGKELTIDFCRFLVDIYPNLKDSYFKSAVLALLYDERIPNAVELEEKYPFTYITRVRKANIATKPFEDVKIIVDKDDSGSSSTVYRERPDAQKALLGNATQLEAFSKGIFTVVKGKRTAGFNYELRLMNHDVLDLLAKNGIVCVPMDMDDGSFERLMNVFRKCTSFKVVFVHPSLLSKPIIVEHPCEQVLPEYEVRSGEILAIAFRYMCVHFFGYKGVYDESLKEYDYLF